MISSKAKLTAKIIKRSRWTSLAKIFVVFVLLWLCAYYYVSNFKSNFMREADSENSNLNMLQQKISDMIGNQFKNDVNNRRYEEVINAEAQAGDEKIGKTFELEDGITDEAKEFMKILGLVNPGENGDPVVLPQNLSADIQKRIQDGQDIDGYNSFVSSMVSLNRNIPDVRSDVCKNKTYTNLPKASIVIPLHNEEWMLLMRTIHSIINRSPPELIAEILLVDDASDREYLHGRLEEFIEKHPIVRIVRSHRRLGIISNRMLGAVNAVGPVIVNVDSHVEVSPGWLEPILDRFSKDMNVMVWPRVSSINKDSLQMYLDNKDAGSLGGFAWNMDFNWISVKWFEGDHPTEMWEPKKSPTVIGALHAISKEFFMHVGMLDPDFDIWGGEDVELSFKVWLCGGKIEYVPCSFVAHMYKAHKYTWPKGKGGYRWNTDRIAEVWLDEYIRYYYRLVGDTKDRNFGDVSERIEIRKKIGCKPFKWYIDNVYPNVPIPDEIRDPTTVAATEAATEPTTTLKVTEAVKDEKPKNATN